jgi:ribosome-associated protein
MDFVLNDLEAFIPLNALLKTLRWVSTGGEANIRIVDGEVKVNGEVAFEKRKKIRQGDIVEYGKQKVNIVLKPV